MQWKFINEQHEGQYHEAMRLLASEDERQSNEAKKLGKEWERLPDDIRMEKVAWLRQHFHACRQPYVSLLTSILSLATPAMIVDPKDPDLLLHEIRSVTAPRC
jgi:hypothetical protein